MSPTAKSVLSSLSVKLIVAVSPASSVALSLLTSIVGATVSTAVPELRPVTGAIVLPATSWASDTSTVTSASITSSSAAV